MIMTGRIVSVHSHAPWSSYGPHVKVELDPDTPDGAARLAVLGDRGGIKGFVELSRSDREKLAKILMGDSVTEA
jgi:hypothetical protein